jgi:hypothetical protein
MDVKTTFRNLVRDQSVSICMLQVSLFSVGQEGGSTYNFSLRIYLASAMQSTHLQFLLRDATFPNENFARVTGGGGELPSWSLYRSSVHINIIRSCTVEDRLFLV